MHTLTLLFNHFMTGLACLQHRLQALQKLYSGFAEWDTHAQGLPSVSTCGSSLLL